MKSPWRFLGSNWLRALLAVGSGAACLLLAGWVASHESGGADDLSLRNKDYPNTHIELIDADLTSPNHWVRLIWTGPHADEQETGPFRSSPGAGFGTNDCNDPAESKCAGSDCTPKGSRLVEGFSNHLPSYRNFRFVTWIDRSRQIGLHSHWDIPEYPASHGCIRLEPYAAQLIHNNSIAGSTRVNIDGTWTPPPTIPD